MFPHFGFFRKGDHFPAHAEILEDSTLIVIPISGFESLLLKNPEISIKLFRVMGEKIMDLHHRLEEQILHNSYERIVLLLLRLCKTHGMKEDDNQYTLMTHFTNRELANMIGSSRETVSRTITQLKKKQLIITNANGTFTINSKKLKDELFM